MIESLLRGILYSYFKDTFLKSTCVSMKKFSYLSFMLNLYAYLSLILFSSNHFSSKSKIFCWTKTVFKI